MVPYLAWAPVFAGVATLVEVQREWCFTDLLDYVEMTEIREDARAREED